MPHAKYQPSGCILPRKPDWKKRQTLIDAWFKGTGSKRLEKYWSWYELKRKMPNGYSAPRFNRRDANTVLTRTVLAWNNSEFTTRDLTNVLKLSAPTIRWSHQQVAAILRNEKVRLGLHFDPYWKNRGLWCRKANGSAVGGDGMPNAELP